jgi:PAS domain S-box-containing protein
VQATIAIENARLYQETLGLKSFNEAIVQSIQQGIVVLDRAMKIRTVNAFMRRNYGWTESAIGQPLFDYRPDYSDFLHTSIGSVLKSGQPETRYGIQRADDQGRRTSRNYYVYPLLEGASVSVSCSWSKISRPVPHRPTSKRAPSIDVLLSVPPGGRR